MADLARKAFLAYQRAGGLDVAAMSVAIDVAFGEMPVVGALYQHSVSGRALAVLDGEDPGHALRHEKRWIRVGSLCLRRDK